MQTQSEDPHQRQRKFTLMSKSIDLGQLVVCFGCIDFLREKGLSGDSNFFHFAPSLRAWNYQKVSAVG